MSWKSLPPEYPGKFFVALISTRRPMNHRPEKSRVKLEKSKIKRPTRKSELFCDSTGKFLSRATANSPSTEVSTLSSLLIKMQLLSSEWLHVGCFFGQGADEPSPHQ
jgi:hypothetical protein